MGLQDPFKFMAFAKVASSAKVYIKREKFTKVRKIRRSANLSHHVCNFAPCAKLSRSSRTCADRTGSALKGAQNPDSGSNPSRF